MLRRTFLFTTISALSVAALDSVRASSSRRPNIIFILADDLGYGDLSCYGQEKFSTPNIDRMAQEGALFTQGYAGSPVCSPSRCALLTGLHIGHARVRDNFALAGGVVGYKGERQIRRASLTPDDVTVAQYLQRAGYKTGVMGKWHLDGYDRAAVPTNFGFDEFRGWLVTEPDTEGYWPTKRMHGTTKVDVPENANGAKGKYDTHLITDDSIDFIRRHREDPFFLFVAYNAPHSAYVAPDFGPYAGENWPDDEKYYASMIHHMDVSIGRLMETLREQGLDENTIIFFSSDNGPRSEPAAYQTRMADNFDSNGGLTGYKRDLYEGGIRVPFIARWPGHIAAGSRNDTPVYFPDFLPTALSLANASAAPTDGMDMTPQLLDPQSKAPERFMYWEFYEPEFRQAARFGQWKAIRMTRGGPIQLYDLSVDPWESNNLADERPDVLRRMDEGMQREHRPSVEYPDPPATQS